MWLEVFAGIVYETLEDAIRSAYPFFEERGRYEFAADNGEAMILEYNGNEEGWESDDGYLDETLDLALCGAYEKLSQYDMPGEVTISNGSDEIVFRYID